MVEHKGVINLLEDKKIEKSGVMSEACVDILGLCIKYALYNSPITQKQIRFDNLIYGEISKKYDIELPVLLKYIGVHVEGLMNAVPLFKSVHQSIRSLKQQADTGSKNLSVEILPSDSESMLKLRYTFQQKEGEQLDPTKKFIKYLSSLGETGKRGGEVIKGFNQKEEENLWSSHPKGEESSSWFRILIETVLKDKILKRLDKHPSMTRENVNKGVKPILKADPVVTVEKPDCIEFFNGNDSLSLGFIPTNRTDLPNVHPDMIPIIKKGGEMFGSHMSQKLLRYQNKMFYDRWKNPLVDDFRKWTIKGGYEKLLKDLGYTYSGENVGRLKKLLYFQASFKFTIPTKGKGCKQGNLIALTEHKNKFGKVGRIDIVAGTMLVPGAVYDASEEDSGRLLIPLIELPEKMVGQKSSWGSQDFLQLLILEEMTLQSREYATKGYVKIPNEKWIELAKEANAPESIIKRIHEVQELFCDPKEGFLEQIDNQYKFNKKNKSAEQHLVEQGKLREKRSKQAKSGKNRKSKTL